MFRIKLMKLNILLLICFRVLANASHDDIVLYAKMAAAAYAGTYEKNSLLIKQISEHNNSIFDNRLLGFYDKKNETIYISIRESSKIKNWIDGYYAKNQENYLARWLPTRWMEVLEYVEDFHGNLVHHALFDFEHVIGRILLRYPNSKVVFVGYGYGGLMAHLLAQKVYFDHRIKQIECHTFNAPGTQEIRTDLLKDLRGLSASDLESHFFNHLQTGTMTGVYEGQILNYPGTSSSMKNFVQQLEH